jgi:hypothetical protein
MERDDRGLIHAAAVLAVVLVAQGRTLAQGGPQRFGLPASRNSAFVETSVASARRDASRKLESAECQEVFSDFRDASGRTLAVNLAELGQTGRSYLDLVVLYQGEGSSPCQNRGTFATTTPGSRAVLVCGSQFAERQRRDPGLAANLLIHEELHSLGLVENPPSSKEITARVMTRCGI